MRYLLMLSVLWLQGMAAAQEYISVTVTSKTDSQPLANVTVSVTNSAVTYYTDKGGNCSIPQALVGDSTMVVFSYVGYESRTVFGADVLRNPVIVLQSSEKQLEEVLVSTGYQQLS